MKNDIKHLSFFFLFLFPLFSFSTEKRSTAQTKNITVFLSGAQIYAECVATIPNGNSEIIIEELPEGILEEQLQVKGEGDFVIQSVVRKINYLSDYQLPNEVKSLKDSLAILTLSLEKEKGIEKIYQQEEEVLMANKSIAGNNTGVSVIELDKVASFITKRLKELLYKKIENKLNQRHLQEQINRINAQLGQMNDRSNRRYSEVIISVSANGAQKAKIILSYFVAQAGWEPYYDIRATDSESPIQLEYKANVWQTTGYDWSDVKLTLSTGNPRVNNNKPEMNPWWLSFKQPVVQYKKSISNRMDKQSAAPAAYKWDNAGFAGEGEDIKEAETMADYTQVNEAETNILFDISIPYSISSDGKKHAVALQNHSIPASYKYFAAPKMDGDAFLVAYVADWEQYELVSTSANIYFDGMFVGKTYINTSKTNDTLEFSLGRDKSVAVKREKLKDLTQKKTIGLNRKEVYVYEISVKNKKKKEITIVVQDQIPVSADKDIVVELLEKSKAEYNMEKGFLQWVLTIKPAKAETVRFGYSIQYPKDKVVYGVGF